MSVDSAKPSDVAEKGSVPAMVSEACNKTEKCVGDYPVASTMVALGAGAVVGLFIATAIGGREAEQRSYFTRLGNQIADQLGKAIPDSTYWNR